MSDFHLKRKASPNEAGTDPNNKKKMKINLTNNARIGGWKSIAASGKVCAPKSISTGLPTAGSSTAARAKIDHPSTARSSISSRGGRNCARIGIPARAKTEPTKSSVSSGGRFVGIAARAKINPRVMMKPEITQDLVNKAVNCVLRARLSSPHSNPVLRHRRKNFKPTKSRFHPDFTSTTTTTVVPKSGSKDLVREAVSWLIKSRLSNATCSNFKLPTTFRTPIRTLKSGCLITSPPVIISSSS